MLVKDLIKQLESYAPDAELIVAYWDKEIVDADLTDDQWAEVVGKYEGGEFVWQEIAADNFQDLVQEVKND